jgi:hypothetical protein
MIKAFCLCVFSMEFFIGLVHAEDWKTTDGKIYNDVTVISHDSKIVTINGTGGAATFPISYLDKDLQKRVINDNVTAKDWVTLDGKTYKDIRVIKYDATQVTFRCSDGDTTLPLQILPEDLRKHFNYDSGTAKKLIDANKTAKEKEDRVEKVQAILINNQFTAKGTIIQVAEGGIMIKLLATSAKVFTYTPKPSPALEPSFNPGSMNDDISSRPDRILPSEQIPPAVEPKQEPERGNAAARTYRDTSVIERAFVECDTTGLVDDQHWEGTIWKVGTYSYPTVSGYGATIPKYTVDRQEAYSVLVPSEPDATASPVSSDAKAPNALNSSP